jgi:hypothetical protein
MCYMLGSRWLSEPTATAIFTASSPEGPCHPMLTCQKGLFPVAKKSIVRSSLRLDHGHARALVVRLGCNFGHMGWIVLVFGRRDGESCGWEDEALD